MSSGTKPSVDENDNIAPQKDLQGSRVPCRGGGGGPATLGRDGAATLFTFSCVSWMGC